MRRGLLGDRRGGVGLMVAGMMPVLVGMAALAVDVGAVQLDTRRLQGIADAAALSAAADPSQAQARAEAAIAAAGWTRPYALKVTTGSYQADPAIPVGQRFTANAGVDAVRVTLDSSTPTFLAAVFGQRAVTIGRVATARQQQFAAFSIGSRLASLDAGLLNTYLAALTGSEIGLSLLDYQALASADVDLFAFLGALRSEAQLSAVTFDDILAGSVGVPQVLRAAAATLGADSATARALRLLADRSGSATVRLATLIDAGPLARQATGGTGIAKVDALAFATTLLQVAAQHRQVSFDVGAGVAGLAATRVTLAIGERARQSPWIAVSADGSPIIRTAQARLYVRSRIAPTALPGLAGLASIEVPMLVELAAAEGRLRSITCDTPATRAVTLEARTDVANAAIGTVDETRLDDFSIALVPATATLVHTPLVDVTGSSRLSLGASEAWQALRFSDNAIAAGTRQTVRASTPVTGIATSLAQQASLGVRVLGLPIAVDPLIRGVGAALLGVSPALDTLIGIATGTLGVGIGEADLRVTGMRCGQPVLVA